MRLKTYRLATSVGLPLIRAYLMYRKAKGKEDLKRFSERLGKPSLPRPNGKLIWLHGASVGETVSMLPLVNKILKEKQDVSIMVTSGTVTSAEILKNRLPERAFHQYIPVDCLLYVNSFIDYWKPDIAFWFESDFWPNLIYKIGDAKIPLILINGRISNRSFAKWSKAPAFMKEMQAVFSLSLGQTQSDAKRLSVLGAKNVDCLGNLKYVATELPVDEKELIHLKNKIAGRITWLCASTHKGEEKAICSIHKKLKLYFPSLLTLIVPRHPERGAEIEEESLALNLKPTRRSKAENISENTDIYIADTIGEMGLFYSLSDVVFVGGSLVPHGGQNFLEPARFNSAVILGKYMHNFAEMTEKALQNDAVIQVQSPEELENTIKKLLTDKELVNTQANKARKFAQQEGMVLELIYEKIKPYLDKVCQVM